MTKPINILFVEDSEDDVLLIVRHLKQNGFEPTHERVETRREMLEALQRQEWDLILSDFTMPTFSGMEAISTYKESELDIPFIVLSGTMGEETAVQVMKAGAHDYLLKDRLDRLAPAIERELADAATRRERKLSQQALISSYQQAETNLKRLIALRNIDLAIANNTELRGIIDDILTHISDLSDIDAIVMHFPSTDGETLEIVAAAGLTTDEISSTPIPLTDPYVGHVFRQNEVLFIEDLSHITAETSPARRFNRPFSSYAAYPLTVKNDVKGVVEFMSGTFIAFNTDWKNFIQVLCHQIAMALDNAELIYKLERANLELTTAYDATIEGWSQALELRDKETKGHSDRVTLLTMGLAKRMGIGREKLEHIRRGVLLHDIGKMGVPDHILLKPGPLSEDEWVVMRQHPIYAYKLLSPIPYLRQAMEIPYCHHERWDGTGYPQALKAEDIPLAARIFSIIDVWDALTSDRPYRPAWSLDQARVYIRTQANKQFDPHVVESFLEFSTSKEFVDLLNGG